MTADPWVSNRQGFPAAGATVAICAPLATTAASVTANLAVFTMASNPITAGFVQGMTIQVAGFTGGDTYFNAGTLANGTLTGGLTILSVTSTTVVAALTHANAAAGTNGTLLQFGNSVTSCAGLSSLFTDSALTLTQVNPFAADGLGNYGAFITPGQYFTQIYGTGITTTMRPISIACVPVATTCGASLGTINSWTAEQDFVNTGTNNNWRAWNAANPAYKMGLNVNAAGTPATFSDTNGTSFGFKCCGGTFFAQDATGLSLLNLTNGQAILSAGTGILTNQFSLNNNGGATLTGGTALTADVNPFNLTWGYNNGAVTFGGLILGITDAASATGSKVFQIKGGAAATTLLYSLDNLGNMTSASTRTLTNCAAVGTAASPSVASCGSSSAGHFSCATNASGATCQVNTTAVTANSEIFVFESDTAVTGTALGVTCNTSTTVIPTSRILASSVAATSFTINLGTVTTNPACFSFFLVN